MALSHDDFWRQVLWRSAKSVAPIYDFFCETEIRNSEMAVRANEQILRLQVSISHLPLMKILERKRDFSNVEQSDVVWENIFLPQQTENFSTLNKVEHKIEVKLILESFK